MQDAIERQNDLLRPSRHGPVLDGTLQVPALQVMLDERASAKVLAVDVAAATLRRWRLLRRGPAFRKVGDLVRYAPEEIQSNRQA
jgi:hypothetical protein